MPINETEAHWCLARLEIDTGIVTFYDSGQTFEEEWREFYIKLRECLQVWLFIHMS